MFVPIPAVDIRGGRCVRLVQGDFGRETRYADDPAEMARHWENEGAERLHVVDLDGARDGVRANAEVISRLVKSVRIPVQVGGGIRSIDAAKTLLEEGAARVVIGTAAVQDEDGLSAWVEAISTERLVVGVDARDGRIAIHGWTQLTDVDVVAYCRRIASVGVSRVVYTDVSRDGMMSGPELNRTREVADVINVIASGGVSTVEHLRALAEAGAEGAIIGTALYEGHLTLKQALAVTC